MSKPSQAEVMAIIENAKKLLTRANSEFVTKQQLTEAHQKLNVVVDSLKDDHLQHQLYLLKNYRRALSLRLQVMMRPRNNSN